MFNTAYALNHAMMSVLIRIASMMRFRNTSNINFRDTRNICFLELSEEFPRDP